MSAETFPNINSLWGAVAAETLARTGVRHAVVSPGSRSAPLTCALASHPGIEAIPVLDERSAGFHALGLAKATGQAVAVVCTSGSAAANLLPAVVEASEGDVPLLVLTADRPPELRACASGQTIDQPKLYGGYVRHYLEMARPSENRLRYLRQTLAEAVRLSGAPRPGPVHLNTPFADPLAPETRNGGVAFDRSEFFADWPGAVAEAEWASRRDLRWASEGYSAAYDLMRLMEALARAEKPLLLAGTLVTGEAPFWAEALRTLLGRLEAPLLVDALSGLRGAPELDRYSIYEYDVILRSGAAKRALEPDLVLQLGTLPTSKELRRWLESLQAPVWVLTPAAMTLDPLHGRAIQVPCRPAALASAAERLAAGAAAQGYRQKWERAGREASRVINAGLKVVGPRFEGLVAALVARHLPEGSALVIANSMPVRDFEYFYRSPLARHPVYCNRGANGIDGTLSTALGIAAGTVRPVFLVTGDLALLHDANGMLQAGSLRGSLTILLINNRGGGIFENLPIAAFDPPFEAFFATPQTVDFGAWAGAFGVEYRRLEDFRAELPAFLGQPPASGVRLLELPTGRKADVPLRRGLFQSAAEAVEKAFAGA